MLDCPNCGDLLVSISTLSTNNEEISVDHCLSCSGTWFDRYEINRIRLSGIYKIAQATDIKRKEPPWGKMERLCPRDFTTLQIYRTQVTPENVEMERCRKCGGIFTTQKVLEKFKMAQAAKMNTYAKSTLPFITLSSVFIPIFFVSLLLFSTFLAVTNLKDAKENQTRAKELLSGLTIIPVDPTRVAILFLTQSKLTTDIEYGTNMINKKTVSVSIFPSSLHQINLTNLTPNTTYKFRIVIKSDKYEKIISEEYRFTTER
ncbi:zf-TFIIB domain-containing protein [Candidatus Gottesmanbacteria bacterium]|nr:zf-TFIIB domain-containing protein [Candidatus Gottesmanbacteria bacterium]